MEGEIHASLTTVNTPEILKRYDQLTYKDFFPHKHNPPQALGGPSPIRTPHETCAFSHTLKLAIDRFKLVS